METNIKSLLKGSATWVMVVGIIYIINGVLSLSNPSAGTAINFGIGAISIIISTNFNKYINDGDVNKLEQGFKQQKSLWIMMGVLGILLAFALLILVAAVGSDAEMVREALEDAF